MLNRATPNQSQSLCEDDRSSRSLPCCRFSSPHREESEFTSEAAREFPDNLLHSLLIAGWFWSRQDVIIDINGRPADEMDTTVLLRELKGLAGSCLSLLVQASAHSFSRSEQERGIVVPSSLRWTMLVASVLG